MTAQLIPRDKLGALTKIGQGGQGVVYGAPNVKTKFAASMVYKEYKTQAHGGVDFTALAAMPALVEESLSYAQAERLISMAAWPCALVEDNGTPTGFVMPAIPAEFFIALTTVKGVSTSTAEFQHLLNHSSVLAARGINIDDIQRVTLLREVASGLAFLHKHGVCVGDISPKNLLFSLTPHEAVYFIDCDAMRINGVSALRQVETPGWDTPAGEELATIYSDTYKLGLLALRLLTGDHDTKSPSHLPTTAPRLLRQIITDTLTNPPQRRPLPEAWTYVLGQAIEDAQHQKKLLAAHVTPISASPAPPPIPEVRSRPTPNSGPPVRPSSPPIATVHSRPPAPPQVGEPSPPHPAPPGEYPPELTPAGRKSKPWKFAVIAAIAALIGAGITGLVINAHRQPASQSAPASPSAPPSSVPTTQPAPPPGPKLEALLLTAEQINAAMGVTTMAVTQPYTAMNDLSANVSNDKACVGLVIGAEGSVYAGTGWNAMHGQNTTQQPPPGKGVDEYVVSFPSAQDATAFFNASAQRWPPCANQEITYASGTVDTVGAVSNTNDTLSARVTEKSTDGRLVLTQRALTVANNIVIDIWVGGLDWNAPDFASIIAHEIAAKVSTAQ